jgi:hypothetical protein
MRRVKPIQGHFGFEPGDIGADVIQDDLGQVALQREIAVFVLICDLIGARDVCHSGSFRRPA